MKFFILALQFSKPLILAIALAVYKLKEVVPQPVQPLLFIQK